MLNSRAFIDTSRHVVYYKVPATLLIEPYRTGTISFNNSTAIDPARSTAKNSNRRSTVSATRYRVISCASWRNGMPLRRVNMIRGLVV
jgi:hypothetical protein